MPVPQRVNFIVEQASCLFINQYSGGFNRICTHEVCLRRQAR
ncbi:hypothetical protein QUB28_26500 [Microcoleus sp. B4-C3]